MTVADGQGRDSSCDYDLRRRVERQGFLAATAVRGGPGGTVDGGHWGSQEPGLREKPRVILNISASPFWQDKQRVRQEMLAALAKRHGAVWWRW